MVSVEPWGRVALPADRGEEFPEFGDFLRVLGRQVVPLTDIDSEIVEFHRAVVVFDIPPLIPPA